MRNRLTALLVDDEPLARVRLGRMLEERGFENLLEAEDVSSARAQLDAHPEIDIVFLDVRMPGATGFELLEDYVLPCPVVFTTAYEEYAVKAFDVAAADYLLKPIASERLDQAVERALFEARETGDARVLVRASTGVRVIRVAEIVYVATADDYSELRLVDGSSVLASVRTSEWEDRLVGHGFSRVHRSTIANLRYATALRRGSDGQWEIVLGRDGEVRDVARRRAEQVRAELERLASA